MLTRRTFLGSVVGVVASKLCANRRCGEACASQADEHAEISGVEVIRLREKGGSRIRSFLEITTDLGARGISGELFGDTPQQFEELMGGLHEALVTRNPNQRELGTVWLWNKLYPDCPLGVFAEGVDPLTGQKIWGTRRERRHTATGTGRRDAETGHCCPQDRPAGRWREGNPDTERSALDT